MFDKNLGMHVPYVPYRGRGATPLTTACSEGMEYGRMVGKSAVPGCAWIHCPKTWNGVNDFVFISLFLFQSVFYRRQVDTTTNVAFGARSLQVFKSTTRTNESTCYMVLTMMPLGIASRRPETYQVDTNNKKRINPFR